MLLLHFLFSILKIYCKQLDFRCFKENVHVHLRLFCCTVNLQRTCSWVFSLFFSLFNVVNWSNPTFWHIWELDVWAQSPGPNYTVTSLMFYKKEKSVNLIYALYCLCFNHIIFYHSLFWPKTGLKMSWNALMDLTGWDACHVFVTLVSAV